MGACAHSIAEPFAKTLTCVESTIEYAETVVAGKKGKVTMAELESEIGRRGREFMRTLLEETIQNLPDAEAILGIEGEDGAIRLRERARLRKMRTKFGVIEYERSGFSAPESDSIMPKDASLNVPANGYSFGLQMLVSEEVAKGSFSDAQSSVKRETGVKVSTSQIQNISQYVSQDFDEFYASRRTGQTAPKGDIVVMTTDSKGVVMRKEDLREETRDRAEESEQKLSKRLSRGEKRNAKRMATVASVYSVAPFPRTAEDFVSELRAVRAVRERPTLTNKRVWASIEKSQPEVISEACREVVRRDRLRNRDLVVLIDGQEHQRKSIEKTLPEFNLDATIILDIIHVIEYLWKAAWCFFAEGTRDAEVWVTEQMVRVLESNAASVAKGLRIKAGRARLEGEAAKIIKTVVGYLEKNLPYLDYARYLKAGYPIATGVIEGACRHLIKDRMDITGARWTLETAEAVLKLRALRSSGDFEEYWGFFELNEQRRNHDERIRQIIPRIQPLTRLK
jgi:hypothetical protein